MKARFEAKVSQCCPNIFLPLALLLVACIGAATAPMAADSQENSKPTPAAVRDGSHDFDFIYGKWRMPNHRLLKRLAGSHEWVDFTSCTEGMPLAGGIGDMDVFR